MTQPKIRKTPHSMKALVSYMQKRAAHEGVEWALSEHYLWWHHDQGVRNFFGVAVDDDGNLLSDAQQPEFFEAYRGASRN